MSNLKLISQEEVALAAWNCLVQNGKAAEIIKMVHVVTGVAEDMNIPAKEILNSVIVSSWQAGFCAALNAVAAGAVHGFNIGGGLRGPDSNN